MSCVVIEMPPLSLIAKFGKVMTFEYGDLTPSHFSASINWIVEMSDATKWALTNEEAALLSGMNVGEYAEARKMAYECTLFALRAKSTERISLLLQIWRKLDALGFDERTSISVFNKPNNSKLLKGESIKVFLLESNSLTGFYAINLYLESISEI